VRHGGPPSPVFHVPGGAASQAVDVRQRRTLLALRSGGPGAWHGQGGWWLQEGARDLNGDQTSYYLSIQPSTHPSIYLSIYLPIGMYGVSTNQNVIWMYLKLR